MIGGGQYTDYADIVKFCRGNDNGIDYAVPQPWLDDVRKLGIKTKFVYSYQEEDGAKTFGTPVAPGDMLLHEISEGRTVVLKTEEYESLVTQLDIARKILKIHRGEKIE
jgi:hypothetical protein